VTNTPSTDGLPQNTGPALIAHPLYAGAGWVEADITLMTRAVFDLIQLFAQDQD
jgi:hypothetical protein